MGSEQSTQAKQSPIDEKTVSRKIIIKNFDNFKDTFVCIPNSK